LCDYIKMTKMFGTSTDKGEEDKSEYEETGDASLIVFVDRGIDIHHQSFRDDDGNTRFVGIWDRGANTEEDRSWRASDRNTYNVGIGRVFRREEINDDILSVNTKNILRCAREISTHATAVASIAAGSDVRDGDLHSIGMAPCADILFVALGKKEEPSESKFIEILDFIYKFSRDENKPAVVNFSFGYTVGTHDGKSSLEIECDRVSDQGLIIVKSAGNERKTKSHAERTLPMIADRYLEWRVSDTFPSESKCLVLLAFSQFANMEFRLLRPLLAEESEEERDSESSPSIFEGTPENNWQDRHMTGEYHFSSTGDTAYYNYDDINLGNLGCHTLTITIDPGEKKSIQAGIWKLEISLFQEFGNSEMEESEKRINAWLDCQPSNNKGRGIEFANVGIEDEKTTLTIPGTANHVITVGSVSSATGVIDPISSLGPTRDERNQPIISAIGTNITVALAGDFSRTTVSKLCSIGGGTSYAAPRLAGAIALCLSAREKRRREDANLNRITAADIQNWIFRAYTSEWQDDLGYGILVDGGRLLAEEARTF
jgi:minor extracellular serine protease Vpr